MTHSRLEACVNEFGEVKSSVTTIRAAAWIIGLFVTAFGGVLTAVYFSSMNQSFENAKAIAGMTEKLEQGFKRIEDRAKASDTLADRDFRTYSESIADLKKRMFRNEEQLRVATCRRTAE
jgi:hypothetical protein